jgi:hypothetical protein
VSLSSTAKLSDRLSDRELRLCGCIKGDCACLANIPPDVGVGQEVVKCVVSERLGMGDLGVLCSQGYAVVPILVSTSLSRSHLAGTYDSVILSFDLR